MGKGSCFAGAIVLCRRGLGEARGLWAHPSAGPGGENGGDAGTKLTVTAKCGRVSIGRLVYDRPGLWGDHDIYADKNWQAWNISEVETENGGRRDTGGEKSPG